MFVVGVSWVLCELHESTIFSCDYILPCIIVLQHWVPSFAGVGEGEEGGTRQVGGD